MPERALDRVPMPEAVAALPRDARGYPTPFFVAVIDGKPDPRISDGRKKRACVERRLCWICGRPIVFPFAFIGGPLSFKNRAYAEPPSHAECAHYAAQVCPFIVGETLRRGVNDKKVEELNLDTTPGGVWDRPERWAVVECHAYRCHVVQGDVLFEVIDRRRVTWYAGGRAVPEEGLQP